MFCQKYVCFVVCFVADESQAIKLFCYVKCIFHFGEKDVVTIVQSGENTYEDAKQHCAMLMRHYAMLSNTMRCNTAELPGICSNQAAGRTCSSQKLYEFFCGLNIEG